MGNNPGMSMEDASFGIHQASVNKSRECPSVAIHEERREPQQAPPTRSNTTLSFLLLARQQIRPFVTGGEPDVCPFPTGFFSACPANARQRTRDEHHCFPCLSASVEANPQFPTAIAPDGIRTDNRCLHSRRHRFVYLAIDTRLR
jgi:hypothetical protein